MKWFALVVAVAMYAAVVIFPHRKSVASLVAAGLLLLAGTVPFGVAVGTLVNWNVLMIYLGSLVIAELFIFSRVPAYVADRIVDKTGSPGLGIVLILVMTGLLSAFVENVATVLVMAPIALALSRKLGITPTYFMVGLAVMANLQGTATLVGDPPSMIFASFAGYSFNDFFFFKGRPSIFFAVQGGMAMGALYFYHYFRKTAHIKVTVDTEKVVSYVPTILLVLMVAGLALTSLFHSGVSLVSGLIVMALAVAGLLWYRFSAKAEPAKIVQLVKGLDWDTMAFLVGIFIVVGAVTEVGLLADFTTFLANAIGGNVLVGFLVVLGVSVVLSGFVDNVPYIIAMLPVVAQLAKGLGLEGELYMFALLVGSCLGGNLTPFGASANIVSVGMLRKQGIRMSFLDWLKIGLPFTALTTATSALIVWFCWR